MMRSVASRFVPRVIPAQAGIQVDPAREVRNDRNGRMEPGSHRDDGRSAADGVSRGVR